MDPTTRPVLFALLVMLAPALLSGVVLLVGALARRGQPLGWIGALAVGAAYLVGHFFALPAPPKFPPASSSDALYWSGVIALAAGLILGWRSRAAWWSALIVAGATCGAIYFSLQRIVGRWGSEEAVSVFVVAAVAVALAFLATERIASKSPGAAAPLTLWIVATGCAIAHVLSGAVTYSSYSAVWAGTLGAALVLVWMRRDTNFARGLSAPVLVQLTTLCAAGVYLAELPRGAALLLILAPVGAAFVTDTRAQRIGPRRALVWRAILVAAPVLAATAWCAWEHAQRTAEYGG